MNLTELQGALARVCLDPTPSPDDLLALGGPEIRWWVYRELVRGRFEQCLAEALPRTFAALTAAVFHAHVARWLAERPPRTRYYRELAPAFVDHLAACEFNDFAAGQWALDLARYERAVIESRDAETPGSTADLCDFEMDLKARVAPSARVLRLGWSVLSEAPTRAPTALVVYRDEATGAVHTLAVSAFVADLLEAMRLGEGTATGCIRAALARHEVALHAGLVESVAEVLGDYLDRGIILGSAREAP